MTLFNRRTKKTAMDNSKQPLIPIKFSRNQLVDPVPPESECRDLDESKMSSSRLGRSSSRASTRRGGKSQARTGRKERRPSAPSRTISFISADQLMENPLRGEVPTSIEFIQSLLNKENKEKRHSLDDDVSEISLEDFDATHENSLQERKAREVALQANLKKISGDEIVQIRGDSFDENCLLHLSSSCSSSSTSKDKHVPLDCSWLHEQSNETWGMTTMPLEGGVAVEWPSDEDKSPLKKKLNLELLQHHALLETASKGKCDHIHQETTRHSNIIWTTDCADGGVETVQVSRPDNGETLSAGGVSY